MGTSLPLRRPSTAAAKEFSPPLPKTKTMVRPFSKALYARCLRGIVAFHPDISRGLACSLGAFTLLNVLARLRESVANTMPLFAQIGATRVLAVSHFYHLPRIKMTYQRHGREVYTVPAKESYTLTKLPIFMLREVAALWVYYLTPLLP